MSSAINHGAARVSTSSTCAGSSVEFIETRLALSVGFTPLVEGT